MRDVMLLAAGRGERMRPLSDYTPKPLLTVAGKPLIVWQIEALVRAGFQRLVINHAWLGEQLVAALADGSQFGAEICWSAEVRALGTAGGIVQALPLLRGPDFAVVSADIHTDFDYGALHAALRGAHADHDLAHLILVDDHRVKQDFELRAARVLASSTPTLTYGNIGVFRRSLFAGLQAGHSADLGARLRSAVQDGRVSGAFHGGDWDNVGTPEDLQRVNDQQQTHSNHTTHRD